MKPVNPQTISMILKNRGFDLLLWSDKFTRDGVSVQRSSQGRAQVYVDYSSRTNRDAVESQVILALSAAGYRVSGSAGVLLVSRKGNDESGG